MPISANRLVSAFLGAAILAACGGANNSQTSLMPSSIAPRNPSSVGFVAQRKLVSPVFSVLHSFEGGKNDGATSYAGMINVDGTLYGTTEFGGGGCAGEGCGTTFSVTPTGKESLFSNFDGKNGEAPQDRPYNVHSGPFAKGLYGTTFTGGTGCASGGCGAVFRVSSGKGDLVYSFKGGKDGENPNGGVIEVNGALYGTTSHGGDSCFADFGGCGTVFKIAASGAETVIHRFAGGKDGIQPLSDLINVNGTLYGTTFGGGDTAGCPVTESSIGCGTVFKITTSGQETVLYRFSGPDGQDPSAGVIDVNGTLYGTTQEGGARNNGTLFTLTASGETVLHSFGGPDGANPGANLVDVGGTLYGATPFGGSTHCGHPFGCGTVFAITTFGTLTVLHKFAGLDGKSPNGVTNVNGTLYGTTFAGGTKGKGTIFAISP